MDNNIYSSRTGAQHSLGITIWHDEKMLAHVTLLMCTMCLLQLRNKGRAGAVRNERQGRHILLKHFHNTWMAAAAWLTTLREKKTPRQHAINFGVPRAFHKGTPIMSAWTNGQQCCTRASASPPTPRRARTLTVT